MTRHEQTQIPGTEPAEEPRIPEVLEAIDRWLDAKSKQVKAADTTRIRHDTLLAELANRGLERYPYVDEKTGRKRYVVADKTPRAKTVNAPTQKPVFEKRWGGSEEPKQDTRVEHRKVSRASVTAEIGEIAADPFAATRGLLDEAKKLQAKGLGFTVQVGNGKPVSLAPAGKPKKNGKGK